MAQDHPLAHSRSELPAFYTSWRGRAKPYDLGAFFERTAVDRAGRRDFRLTEFDWGFRVEIDDWVGRRRNEVHRLADGVLVATMTTGALRPQPFWARSDGMIGFGVLLRGGYRSRDQQGRSVNVSGPAAFGFAEPGESAGCCEYFPTEQQYAAVYFRDAAALRAFGAPVSSLPAGFLSSTADGIPRVFLSEPEQRLLRTARELIACPYEGDLRHLFVAAKARELLCHVVAARRVAESIEDMNRLAQPGTVHVIHRARALLEQYPGGGLTVGELAERLGVRPNFLMRAFKREFGVTVQEYARVLRLTEARRQLVEDAADITEIALAAGYSQHSSFTTAYRAQFGESPSETRVRHTGRDARDGRE